MNEQTIENALIHYAKYLERRLKRNKDCPKVWTKTEAKNVLAIAVELDVQTSTQGLDRALAERIDDDTDARLLAVQLEETF